MLVLQGHHDDNSDDDHHDDDDDDGGGCSCYCYWYSSCYCSALTPLLLLLLSLQHCLQPSFRHKVLLLALAGLSSIEHEWQLRGG